jgi:hypothetical protein
VSVGVVGAAWSSDPVGEDEELAVSVVVAGAVVWSTDGVVGAAVDVSPAGAVVVAVEVSTVLPDVVVGALGAVGVGASVGVGLATTVVCVALVAVSVVLDVVSLSRSPIVPPRQLSTIWF